MARPITISLSPNTEPDDVQRAAQLLFRPWQWHSRQALDNAYHALQPYAKGYHISLTSSGRQALYDALQALGVHEGDEVILQAFTCIAVPEPVLWTKATPVYADINPATFNLTADTIRPKINNRTKAIIVQHTFGIPAPIEEIRQLADEHNISIIEDCAHALGGTYQNQHLGTFGDISIFSFGRDKTISSVFGGAILTTNAELHEKITALHAQRHLPPRRWVVQQLLHPVLLSKILPMYFSGSGKAALVAAQKLKLLSKAVEVKERIGQMPRHIAYSFSPALAQLLNQQLPKLPRFTARRQTIAARYQQELASLPGLKHPTPPSDSNPAWLRYPLLVDDPQAVHSKAKQQPILLGDWYNAPLVPGNSSFETFGYKPGSCPQAEQAAQHIINLPTYPTLTDSQVSKIIEFIKQETSTLPSSLRA